MRLWARDKLATQELLGNIRVKLETYRLRGYDAPEGLRVEVRPSLSLSVGRVLWRALC